MVMDYYIICKCVGDLIKELLINQEVLQVVEQCLELFLVGSFELGSLAILGSVIPSLG